MTAPWYYCHDGHTHGPFSTEEIKEHAARKKLLENDLLWQGTNGRKDAVAAQAALDFANLPLVAAPAPDWLADVDQGESKGPVPLPAASKDTPDWLDDVAQGESKGPVPGPAPGAEAPGWLEDLRLWYGLESYAAAKTAQPSGAILPPIGDANVPLARPVAAHTAPPVREEPGITKPPAKPEDRVAENALRETGFDLKTGQIVDADKFRHWQRSAPAQQPTETNQSLFEVFRKARTAIEKWVDEESRRPLIMAGDLKAITTDGQLLAILGQFHGYGPAMQGKLMHHLEFMVENRRRYYMACQGS